MHQPPSRNPLKWQRPSNNNNYNSKYVIPGQVYSNSMFFFLQWVPPLCWSLGLPSLSAMENQVRVARRKERRPLALRATTVEVFSGLKVASCIAKHCGVGNQPYQSGKEIWIHTHRGVMAKTSSSWTSEWSQLVASLVWCDWPWRQNPLLALHRGRLKRIDWSCWNCGQRRAVWWDYVAIWSTDFMINFPHSYPFTSQFSG